MLDQRDDPSPLSLADGSLESLDVVGVATYSDSFPYVKAVTEIARRERADRPIVLGGPTVTSVPRVLMENTEADYGVLGEGELTLIELMDHLIGKQGALPPKDILGLAWKDEDGQVRINPPRPQMWNLDPVPFQDLSVWPRVHTTGEAPEIYMQYSRGCPMSCSFCFRTMPRMAFKSPSRTRRELDSLRQYRFRFVWWNDLTFLADRRRALALMDALAAFDFRWSAFTRVTGVDVPILRRMRESGCDIVMYGFESITQDVLDGFGKRAKPHQIINAIEATREAGLKVGGLFIVGAPTETEESLKNLIEFCDRFKGVTRVKYLSLLPGTPEYFDALARGIIEDEVEHLYFLARERSVEDDEFINVCGLPDELLRSVYGRINHQIQVRPYAYWDPVNRYLPAPTRFKDRPIPSSS